MIEITNLNEAKNLAVGEHFIFGVYQGQFVKWRKIDEHLAISEKILDCIVFNDKLNNKYTESTIRKWCNDILGKALGLSEDIFYTLAEKEIQHYFSTDELRQAKPTEWAIMHGVYVDSDGNSPYWTSSPMSNYYSYVRCVYSSGSFDFWYTNVSHIGVRPVLKI